jgi:hypothetical protein
MSVAEADGGVPQQSKSAVSNWNPAYAFLGLYMPLAGSDLAV